MTSGARDIVVDLDHLSQYTSGDRALEAELFNLFLINGKAYVAAMSAASDLESWREAAHTLKGSARGIGAVMVARLSETAEGLAPERFEAEKAEVAAELEQALAAVESFVKAREVSP
jgi:HPt (histidine-containing phosphotransfer) domain-containing protein